MTIGQGLEFVRKQNRLSLTDVCNIMNVSESEYMYIYSHSVKPTVYQLIMFVSYCQCLLSFV